MKIDHEMIRSKLNENVIRFISTRGVRGWNMDELAVETGVTKRTLYKMIESKEKLIEQVLLDTIDANHTRLMEIVHDDSGYLSKLKKITVFFPRLIFDEHSNFYRVVYLEYPAIENEMIRRRKLFAERFEKFIRLGIESGYFLSDIQPKQVIELIQAVVLYYIKEGGMLTDEAQKGLYLVMRGFLNIAYLEEWK